MGFNLDSYEQVKDRITRFYANNPEGRITTELVTSPGELAKHAGFKAYCWIGDILKATGYAYEAQGQGVNRDAWVENAETSAIGRALANMDYCGSIRPSREEMSKVGNNKVEPAGIIIGQISTANADELAAIATRIKGLYQGADRDAIGKAYQDRIKELQA